MKRIIVAVATITSLLGVGGGMMVVSPTASPLDPFGACTGQTDSTVCKGKGEKVNSTVKNVINILLYVIGIAAVIMIIVGGIMYTLSGGDASNVKNAKNTIVYAVVGLVIASLAYVIVNFVLSKL